MAELKPKKSARRRVVKAANSPEPAGPVGGSSEGTPLPSCGHDGCSTRCVVRYVGPTTQVRDHHIVHAARGVTHIWSAAIITGLAIVLTGTIAFNSARAGMEEKTELDQADAKRDIRREIYRLSQRLEEMDALLQKIGEQCIKPSVVKGETEISGDVTEE